MGNIFVYLMNIQSEVCFLTQKIVSHLAVEMIVILLRTEFGVLLNVMLLKC